MGDLEFQQLCESPAIHPAPSPGDQMHYREAEGGGYSINTMGGDKTMWEAFILLAQTHAHACTHIYAYTQHAHTHTVHTCTPFLVAIALPRPQPWLSEVIRRSLIC